MIKADRPKIDSLGENVVVVPFDEVVGDLRILGRQDKLRGDLVLLVPFGLRLQAMDVAGPLFLFRKPGSIPMMWTVLQCSAKRQIERRANRSSWFANGEPGPRGRTMSIMSSDGVVSIQSEETVSRSRESRRPGS